MKLNELITGQQAIIIEMDMNHIPLKLVDMECLPGNTVEIIQIAPLNDPIYIKVNHTHLSIRRELAQHITVELI